MSTHDQHHTRTGPTARVGEHGRRPTGRINLGKPEREPLPEVVDGEVIAELTDPAPVDAELLDAELLDTAPADVEPAGVGKPGTDLVPARSTTALHRAGRKVIVAAATARTVVTHPRTRTTSKAVGRHLWFPVAGAGVAARRWRDAHGASRYERMLRAAEAAGDREALLEWEARDVAEKARRHGRVMDWVRSPVKLIRALGTAVLGTLGVLLLLGIVLAIGNRDVAQVIAPISAVIAAVTWVVWFFTVYGTLLVTAATVGGVAYLWQLGRAHTAPPAWVAPAEQAAGRDVIPDEGAILNALRNLNLPALNRKVREGWQPRWVLGTGRDGKGWRTQLLLPEGVTVEMIVNAKAVLAHNLLRLPVEVWPTEPRNNPGVLDLWVADQGSLTKPVEPWPLLTEGTCDYFRGVPVGVDPRGKVVMGRFFGGNWGVAGTMGSGKSTLIITALLGAMLDPLVEIDVYCMAINADYDPLKPRLRTLFKSDEPEHIPAVLDALRALMSELSDRGRKLSAAGEPKLTRELAERDPAMRPRVVVIDECQELFVSDIGDEAAELVEKIVAKARKYGVTLIFATPVPSADSLPRKVAKVLSNRACFAIGDHQGNDAILGTGKHKAGISATTLRPMTEDGEGNVDPGDIGTAMTVGFTPTDGLMRCFWVRRGGGVDEVTPVVERAMALREAAGVDATTAPEAVEPERLDPLADVAAVLAGHKRLRTQEVLAALAVRNPTAYRRWTFTDLAEALPDAARPYKSGGVMVVAADRIAEALADRADGTDHGPDAETDEHEE
jgi:DNA segregation ATPase FtsK/SpoIIIE, S-DNA-T family